MRRQGVISDFGGVLTTPMIEAFAAVQRDSGVPTEAVGEAIARLTERDGANPLFELETGRLRESEFLAGLEGALADELGREISLHGFTQSWFANLHPNTRLIDHMRTLRARRFRMALLTNNVREWEPLWRPKLPVDEIFDVVVDSGFVGVRKPDPEIYRLTLERMGLPPESCVFLDDTEINCEAARHMGIESILFRSTEQAIEDLEAALEG